MNEKDVKKAVRESYAKRAKQRDSCCGTPSPCCGGTSAKDISKTIGYSKAELESVPEAANLGLGCGNPVALASLKEGETVLDLGAGAGIDCFLAASKVGKTGKVIGVDMTAEMLDRARKNTREGKYTNVEFRLGEIENLPVADNNVDVIISNCVINLSPDKKQVFREAFRVLKPGGRIMVSDIVLLEKLPEFIKDSVNAYVSCISGALLKDDYISTIKEAGFNQVKIMDETVFPIDFITSDPVVKPLIDQLGINLEELKSIASSVVSVKIKAVKPG